MRSPREEEPLRVMATPRQVDVEITTACNLRCAYCSHFTSPGDVGEDLPLETWRDFFAELGRAAVMSVTLSGGEPFVRPDLLAIIEAVCANRLRFSILTNGTCITEEGAAHIAATGRCDSIQISIDGADPFTHDAFRGRGSFGLAVEGVRILREHGLPVTVRVTVHRRNVRSLPEIARFLLEDLGLPSFSTNSASHMGLCRKNAAMIQLTPEEHSEAMDILMDLAERYEGRIDAQAGPLADGRLWSEMERARLEGLDTLPGRGYLTGCGGPYQSLAVRADGAYVPCSQLGHLVLGYIGRDDLLTVWRTHPELQRLRRRVFIPLEGLAFCRGCPYVPYCTGNCPALAYNLTGETDQPSPDACLRLFLERGGRLPRARAGVGGH